MPKYLFIDGTNVIREVETKEDLKTLIQSAVDPSKAKVWLFNTSEWISVAEFTRQLKNTSPSPISGKTPAVQPIPVTKPKRQFPGWIKKTLVASVILFTVLLVYNFTRLSWTKAEPLALVAARPENTPLVNVDSLIQEIEWLRGQKLDKTTRTNLRIRNTWPDLLQLQLSAARDTSREGNRFYEVQLSVDNSTGYNIDNATVDVRMWKSGDVIHHTTVQFANISYASPAKKEIEGVWKADSITVSFSSIRSKSFNFCYSSDKKSNYGNYNDRWFCR